MPFLLGTDTVFAYLEQYPLPGFQGAKPLQVHPRLGKNFNLLVEFSNQEPLLLKQESYDRSGRTRGDLLNEWQLHQWIAAHADLHPLQSLMSQAIAFDPAHSILILRYQAEYGDLETRYDEWRTYPPALAHVLGTTLGQIHRRTLDHPAAAGLLEGGDRSIRADALPVDVNTLDRVTPETFGAVTEDGLKFYELMQRYDSLNQAIARLMDRYQPCCLVHGDLKLSNLLLHHDWQVQSEVNPGRGLQAGGGEPDAPIRLIDWEKWLWGDPAFDLGYLVAEYLKRWLKSLMVSRDMPIDLALRLATTPLEQIQPSLVRLIQAYLDQFPQVWQRFPDFLERTMGFAGLALIQSIQAHIHYYEPFGNGGVCMLQVAKTLLCAPAAAIPTVLGQRDDVVRSPAAPLSPF